MNTISSNSTFGLVLNATPSVELLFTAGWTEIGGTPKTAEQGNNEGETNGSTGVELVAAPATGYVRQLTSMSVYNPNSEAVVVSMIKTVDSTGYPIGKWTLQAGQSLIYTDKAGFLLPDNGISGAGSSLVRCDRVVKSGPGTHTITFRSVFASDDFEVEQSIRVLQNGVDIGYQSISNKTIYGFDVEVYSPDEGEITIIYTATLKN